MGQPFFLAGDNFLQTALIRSLICHFFFCNKIMYVDIVRYW